MAETVKQQAFQVFDLLTEKEQNLIFELIKSLAPDDMSTPDDISTHNAAMRDYRCGETVSHDAINWN
jgi:hypothetical protein